MLGPGASFVVAPVRQFTLLTPQDSAEKSYTMGPVREARYSPSLASLRGPESVATAPSSGAATASPRQHITPYHD